MSDTRPNPFIDPNLTQDDIPEEDLFTLARLAGEEVRRKNALLRAKGLFPEPKTEPARRDTGLTSTVEDIPSRG